MKNRCEVHVLWWLLASLSFTTCIQASSPSSSEQVDKLGIVGLAFDFGPSMTSWPGLQASIQALARDLLNENGQPVVSAGEAEQAGEPVFRISLSIEEVDGCLPNVVTHLKIALTRLASHDSVAGGRITGDRRITLWRREIWSKAKLADPWPQIESSLRGYLGDFATDVALANVASQQMAAVGLTPSAYGSDSAGLARPEGMVPVGLEFRLQFEREDRWRRERSAFESRAHAHLQQSGFIGMSIDDAIKNRFPTVMLYLKILEFDECPGATLAVLSAELAVGIDLDRASEQLLSARRAVPIAEELSWFQVSIDQLWPEISRRLDLQLADLLGNINVGGSL